MFRNGLVRIAILAGLSTTLQCATSGEDAEAVAGDGNGEAGNGGFGVNDCDICDGDLFIPCTAQNQPGTPISCAPQECFSGFGCGLCAPGSEICVGGEVRLCAEDGQSADELVEVCDASAGLTCHDGECRTGCDIADSQPSNVGCEFWAVDLDQQDGGGNDPASEPWGLVLSNAGEAQANVTIEWNDAPYGSAPVPKTVNVVSVKPGDLEAVLLPTRELDCGVAPNQYESPGTCLSSQAFRITSSSPIVVDQFNLFENTNSNDASLLLPTNALGLRYRVLGWNAGPPILISFPGLPPIIDRSYVTVVGVVENTQVKVRPSWRIRGNPPIAATQPGGEVVVTLGPFDVLNLETDDGAMTDDMKTIADLSGTDIESNKPVAVFSGVETTSAPGPWDIPTYPGWDDTGDGGDPDSCCLDHLEEQMFPMESVGTKYVLTRSPIRSTGSYREPDMIRFVGVAEDATVTTTLPPPWNSFTLAPGEVKTTYAQHDVTVTATKPVMIGQILISQGYVQGARIGDPAMTMFAPVEQYRTEYVILTPPSWTQNWVVIAAEVGSTVTIDGSEPTGCVVESAGTIDNKSYEARRCPLHTEGVHTLSGSAPFGIIAYGYGSAGSYAFAGGADVKRIYEPPPPR